MTDADRIEDLEAELRGWKWACAGAMVVCVLLLIINATFVVQQKENARRLAELESQGAWQQVQTRMGPVAPPQVQAGQQVGEEGP